MCPIDFRSPLTSIKGYVEAMLDGTIPPEMQERYLKVIAFESTRLEKLTRSLLTLNELDVKKRMMHMRRFDINETIRTTAATFEGTCSERNIRLELPPLLEKELFLSVQIWNRSSRYCTILLDNAVKFSSDNSSITLETTVNHGKVFVSVKDHGSGIPKESLSRIWDRFYKIDASRGKDRKGTGLGLAIVKEIINAHKQNIKCDQHRRCWNRIYLYTGKSKIKHQKTSDPEGCKRNISQYLLQYFRIRGFYLLFAGLFPIVISQMAFQIHMRKIMLSQRLIKHNGN